MWLLVLTEEEAQRRLAEAGEELSDEYVPYLWWQEYKDWLKEQHASAGYTALPQNPVPANLSPAEREAKKVEWFRKTRNKRQKYREIFAKASENKNKGLRWKHKNEVNLSRTEVLAEDVGDEDNQTIDEIAAIEVSEARVDQVIRDNQD